MSRLLRSTICITTLAGGLAAVLVPRMGGAEQIKLDVGLSHPYLLANKKQTAYLKISMTGSEMKSAEQRAPLNVAVVLDKSGSMAGDKIQRAKEAARMFIDRLGPEDIVSVVAYEGTVNVLVPATKASDKGAIMGGIDRLAAGGSTALFAGVSKGAAEVRKFLDRDRVSRIVLLSDGLANIGPSSPGELGALGASLIKEGIAVTTRGLGLDYNEDLMTQLARKSDGNHGFVSNSEQLAKLFQMELGAALAVAAQEITVRVTCAEGVRPVRSLGIEADITGRTAVYNLNQLYSNHERYVILEVEVPATAQAETLRIADATVSYTNMATKTTELQARPIEAELTGDQAQVEKHSDPDVMSAAAVQIATLTNALAVTLRDQGKVKEAQKLLFENSAYCRHNGMKYNSKELQDLDPPNHDDGVNILYFDAWPKRRKIMRARQHVGANRPVDILRN